MSKRLRVVLLAACWGRYQLCLGSTTPVEEECDARLARCEAQCYT